jgi:putative oxidoreductase
MTITSLTQHSFWPTYGIFIARLIMAGLFAMAAVTKFMDVGGMAAYVESVGFPYGVALIWLAALLETFIALAFLTGKYFRLAALIAIPYILFLAFAFHGPSMWTANQMEFGFFVDHFMMVAGFLYMLGFGPGTTWTLGKKV